MAEFTADLYFDDILQPKEDYSDIKNNFNLTIKREESFNGGENILRELSRTTLDVKGCCYTYLCEKFKNNPCGEVKVYIEITIHGEKLTFNGLFRLSSIDWFHKKKIAKIVGIKDNSFSGLIQGYTNVDTKLYNTKTINCEPNKINSILINTPTIPSTYSITDIFAFDVLEVFKYIIAYFTDNKITVKSDFLTNTKLAITTGYSMHNSIITLDNSYPKLSFDTLFEEVNKNYPIKKVIEYELDGTPYLRIEEESYTYEDTEILELSTIPLDFECHLDVDRLYNGIKVGSKTTKVLDTTTPIVTGISLTLWSEETYNGCGGCVGEKKTEVNLVNNFIIDANVIHEAMNIPIGDDYDNDDEIFLLHYFFDGVNNKLVGNNTSMYNLALNNENKLNRYVGITNSCITTGRFAKYGFNAINDAVFAFPYPSVDVSIHDGYAIAGGTVTTYLACRIESFDNYNTHSLVVDISNIAGATGFVDNGYMSLFTCQENGIYKFRSASKIQEFLGATDPNALYFINIEYSIRFVIFADNTLSSIINTTPYTIVTNSNIAANKISSYDISSPSISLVVGNVVAVEITISDGTLPPSGLPFNYYHIFKESVFELLEDNTTCQDIEQSINNFRPFISNFEMPLSACDYNKLKINPKGYINIDGIKCWISELDYGIARNTKFNLITNKLIC